MNITMNTSAKQFVEMVNATMDEFDINDMYTELYENFISNGIDGKKLEHGLDHYNVIEDFIRDSQNETDFAEDIKSKMLCQIQENNNKFELENFSTNFVDLFKKYDYNNFMQKIYIARTKFDSFRKEYIFQTFLNNTEGNMTQGNVVIEECFITSIDINLKIASDDDSNVRIFFEDLDGNSQNILTTLVENAEVDLDGNLSFRPEGYWVGHSCFDSFRVQYYWDVETEDWVPVPIHLIQRLVMENELDDDSYESDYGDEFE